MARSALDGSGLPLGWSLAALAATAILCAVGTGAAGESAERDRTSESPRAGWRPLRVADRRLSGAYQVHDKVISGAVPDRAAFEALRARGVRTIISVDGARPDVELAKEFGLRYVHLPHGYDGIPPARALQLAKAVRDLEGPIYIHCHHGRHRSPAAAATACVAAGLLLPEQALPVLQAAGTSEKYRGLYQSVRSARPVGAAVLDRLETDFPETARVPPLAEAMIALERTHAHLDRVAKAGWKAPPAHPDLDPVHEAVLLREHYSELLRTPDVQRRPGPFARLLRDAEQAAQRLENGLRAGGGTGISQPRREELAAALAAITAHCQACHERFRDRPERAMGVAGSSDQQHVGRQRQPDHG